MSDQTDVKQPASPVPTVSQVLATEAAGAGGGTEPVVYEEQRRRRRRRRRRNDVAATPQARLHYFLLALIGIAFFLALFPQLRHNLIGNVRHMIPHVNLGGHLEVVALGIAGLIVLYFTPGVEERVLRLLGIKRDKHRRRRG